MQSKLGIETCILMPSFFVRQLNASILCLSALQLLCKSIHIRLTLPRKTSLHLVDQRGEVHQHTFLLGVSFLETHFLDADLTVGEFVFAQDDAEGDTALFGSLKLLGELGLDLVGEFGLVLSPLVSFLLVFLGGLGRTYLDTSVPESLADVHTLL